MAIAKTCWWPRGAVPPGTPAVNAVNMHVTAKKELTGLMANEFHLPGSRNFAQGEVENYLRRLTGQQVYFLFFKKYKSGNWVVPPNRLVAFITLGDGQIERFMGGDLCIDYEPAPSIVDRDNVRSNASFALFRKTVSGGVPRVELVFYTRFFVISYAGSLDKNATAARNITRKYNYSNKIPETERAELFTRMTSMYYAKQLGPVDSHSPKRHQIQITGISHPYFGPSYIPYMMLRDTSMKTPGWFMSGSGMHNTIHGTISTKGCWMLCRNYVWNWPREETNHPALCRELLKYRRNGFQLTDDQRNTDMLKKLLVVKPSIHQAEAPVGIDRIRDRFEWWGRNSTYLQLLHHFAGIEYDKYSSRMFYYPAKPAAECAPANTAPNCFDKQNVPKWTKNIFGDMANNGSWCDLYLFKRSDRFTFETGDVAIFK